MGILIAIAAIIGFILGIQTPLAFGLLLFALFIVSMATGKIGDGGLESAIPVIVCVVMLVGMLAGDIYVHLFYPEQSEIAPLFNGIPNPFEPPGVNK